MLAGTCSAGSSKLPGGAHALGDGWKPCASRYLRSAGLETAPSRLLPSTGAPFLNSSSVGRPYTWVDRCARTA